MNNHSKPGILEEKFFEYWERNSEMPARSKGTNASKSAPSNLLVVAVVGKTFHDEVVDPVEGGLLLRGVLDGHGNEGNVGVGRLDHVFGGVVLRYSVVRRIGGAHVPMREMVRCDKRFEFVMK